MGVTDGLPPPPPPPPLPSDCSFPSYEAELQATGAWASAAHDHVMSMETQLIEGKEQIKKLTLERQAARENELARENAAAPAAAAAAAEQEPEPVVVNHTDPGSAWEWSTGQLYLVDRVSCPTDSTWCECGAPLVMSGVIGAVARPDLVLGFFSLASLLVVLIAKLAHFRTARAQRSHEIASVQLEEALHKRRVATRALQAEQSAHAATHFKHTAASEAQGSGHTEQISVKPGTEPKTMQTPLLLADGKEPAITAVGGDAWSDCVRRGNIAEHDGRWGKVIQDPSKGRFIAQIEKAVVKTQGKIPLSIGNDKAAGSQKQFRDTLVAAPKFGPERKVPEWPKGRPEFAEMSMEELRTAVQEQMEDREYLLALVSTQAKQSPLDHGRAKCRSSSTHTRLCFVRHRTARGPPGCSGTPQFGFQGLSERLLVCPGGGEAGVE